MTATEIGKQTKHEHAFEFPQHGSPPQKMMVTGFLFLRCSFLLAGALFVSPWGAKNM
jgi:hypothetical protein